MSTSAKLPGVAGVHGGDDLGNTPFDKAPSSLSQYDNGYLAVRKVLLVADVFVCRHQNLEPCGLGLAEQFAVLQFFPPTGASLRNRVVVDQIPRKSARGAVVE